MKMGEGEVRNISHVVIHTADVMRSIKYYQLLGFQVNRIISTDPQVRTDINDLSTIPLNHTDAGDFYCVGLSLGKDPRAITALELMQWQVPAKLARTPEPEHSLGLVRIALNVTQVAAIRERLIRQGHRVESLEHLNISPTLSAAFVHAYDPDGNWLSLMEWIKHPPR